MKVGLFFGSFNPIHIGHLIIANHFAEFSDVDEVWFVVSPHNPLKEEDTLLDADLRFKMVEASLSVNDKLIACDVEFSLPRPSYSVNTLQYLKSKHPWYDFIIIMGTDTFNDIKRWKDYKSILTNYPIYLYERRDHPVRNAPNEARLAHFKFPLLDISATYIRELIKNKKSVQFLVSEKALKILDKKLKK